MTEQLSSELARCPTGMAARLLSVSVRTLHAWRVTGRIGAEQTAAGRWLFDVRPFLAEGKREKAGARS